MKYLLESYLSLVHLKIQRFFTIMHIAKLVEYLIFAYV